MTRRVPGTESPSSFGKTFADVFSPTLSQLLFWIACAGGALSLLALLFSAVHMYPGLALFWLCWLAAYAGMKIYHAGAEAGMQWQRDTHQVNSRNTPPTGS